MGMSRGQGIMAGNEFDLGISSDQYLPDLDAIALMRWDGSAWIEVSRALNVS